MSLASPTGRKKPLYLKLAEDLRSAVLARGDEDLRLPTEADLCRRHGVSRITVRKALDILTSEGLIERTPGRGTFVRRDEDAEPRTARGLVVAINVSAVPSVMNFLSLQVLGASDFREQHGAHISVKRNPHGEAVTEELLRNCLTNGVRGFLCFSHSDETARCLSAAAQRLRMPMVLTNTRMDDADLDYVTSDNFTGGRMAADYLLDLGHREIASVYTANDVSSRDRWEGFERRVREVGGRITCFAPWVEGCDDPESALVENAHRFTAVQCGHDKLAARSIQLLFDRGLRVPDDISVMGYDNCIAHCEYARVPITTIEQPAREIGARAAQFLWERMTGRQPAAPRRCQLPPALVVRSSVAPPSARL